MSAPKTLVSYGTRAVIEGTYNGGGSPAGTDAIIPMELPSVDLDYAHDGERGASPSGGMLSRVAQSGLFGTLPFLTHCYTPGVAYSASVYPSVDRALKACGFQATVVTTGGSESYTYNPEVDPSALDSLFWEVFYKGQQYDLAGVYSDLTIAADGQVIPEWTFDAQGTSILPVTAAVPTLTYPHIATKPVKATTLGFNFGTFTNALVRSFEFKLNREIDPRIDDNSGGHGGFTPGNRNPTLNITIESVALGATSGSVINPYQIRDLGTEGAVSLNFGNAVQFSNYDLNLSNCQIVDVDDDGDGASAIWNLVIEAHATPGNQDDVEFVFD